jgi:hypothetical protein
MKFKIVFVQDCSFKIVFVQDSVRSNVRQIMKFKIQLNKYILTNDSLGNKTNTMRGPCVYLCGRGDGLTES